MSYKSEIKRILGECIEHLDTLRYYYSKVGSTIGCREIESIQINLFVLKRMDPQTDNNFRECKPGDTELGLYNDTYKLGEDFKWVEVDSTK